MLVSPFPEYADLDTIEKIIAETDRQQVTARQAVAQRYTAPQKTPETNTAPQEATSTVVHSAKTTQAQIDDCCLRWLYCCCPRC